MAVVVETLGGQTQESRTLGESESVHATSERKIKPRSPIREENSKRASQRASHHE